MTGFVGLNNAAFLCMASTFKKQAAEKYSIVKKTFLIMDFMKDYDFDPNTDLDDLLIADADLDDFQPLLQSAQELNFPGTNTSTEHNEDDALTSNDVGELLADVSSILSDSTWNKDVSNTNEFSNTFEQLVSELNAIESNEKENFEYSNEPQAPVTGHTPVKDNNDKFKQQTTTSPTIIEENPTLSNLVEDSSPEPKKPRLSEITKRTTDTSLLPHQQASGFSLPVTEYSLPYSPDSSRYSSVTNLGLMCWSRLLSYIEKNQGYMVTNIL